MPATNIYDLPHELHVKIAESIQERRDFRNFSHASRALNDSANNAFANNLGLTGEHVHVLKEILGSARADKLVRDLVSLQIMEPIPTWPNPLQIMAGYIKTQSTHAFLNPAFLDRQIPRNTAAHARQFLSVGYSRDDVNQMKTAYQNLLGEIVSGSVHDEIRVLLNYHMKLQFKTDAQFVQFLRLLYHKPREAVKVLDPILIYVMNRTASRYVTGEQLVPGFVLTVNKYIRNTGLDNLRAERRSAGASWSAEQRRTAWRVAPGPPSGQVSSHLDPRNDAWLIEPFLRKATELDRRGSAAIMDYIKHHLHSQNNTVNPDEAFEDMYLAVSIDTFTIIFMYNREHPNDPNVKRLVGTTFWKTWDKYPLDFNGTHTATDVFANNGEF
jgi:hypothetical protein